MTLRYGAGFNFSGEYRVLTSLMSEPRGLRILCEVQIVTDVGTQDERTKNAPSGLEVHHELMDMLETIQGTIALQAHSRFIEQLDAQERSDGPAHAPRWDGSPR